MSTGAEPAAPPTETDRRGPGPTDTSRRPPACGGARAARGARSTARWKRRAAASHMARVVAGLAFGPRAER